MRLALVGLALIACTASPRSPSSLVTTAERTQYVRTGRLVALGVPSAKRSPALPDVPTFEESGFAPFDVSSWVGIFAPKGTAPDIVTTLRGAIGKVVQSEQFLTALTNAGQELAYLDGPDFQKFWDIDGAKTDEAVRSIGRQG